MNPGTICQRGKEEKAREQLRERILAERKNGNVVIKTAVGYISAPLEEFIKQPADGILYDLNRGEEVSLSFMDDPKWINDFAVALTIRKLKDKLAEYEKAKP